MLRETPPDPHECCARLQRIHRRRRYRRAEQRARRRRDCGGAL